MATSLAESLLSIFNLRPSFEHYLSTLNSLFYLAPAIAPENVRVRNADTSGSIIVEWDPPSEQSTNGPLRGYTVYYREQNYYGYHYYYRYEYLGHSINTSASTTTVVLGNLDGGKKYEIAVAAFNLYLGPRSGWQRFIVGKFSFYFSIQKKIIIGDVSFMY